jgi:glycine cleavage system H protein
MKYTDSHEWIQSDENGSATVGISQFAQKELGDIVYVELPLVGKTVCAGDEVVVLESTKAAADVYSPATGTIIAVNEALSKSPELVNQFPEKEGWLFKITLADPTELNALMDVEAYQAMLNS